MKVPDGRNDVQRPSDDLAGSGLQRVVVQPRLQQLGVCQDYTELIIQAVEEDRKVLA
jgi:hypothetical protein